MRLKPEQADILESPEFRLVVAGSWDPPDSRRGDHSDAIRSLAEAVRDWGRVEALILRHGVVGQFCRTMAAVGWPCVPGETRERLNGSRKQQVMRAMGQVAELARMARLLNEAGIAVMPLKGVVLSQELYGDPCVRSSGDIDILVHPGDVPRAEAILQEEGYTHGGGFHGMSPRQQAYYLRAFHHHEYVSDSGSHHIELHWRSAFWTQQQIDMLWNSAGRISWHGSTIFVPDRTDLILFLCDHGARHDWVRLQWISDIARLLHDVGEVGWEDVSERAYHFGLERIICQSALLLEILYGIRIPEALKRKGDQDILARTTAEQAIAHLLSSPEELERMMRRGAGIRDAIRIKKIKPSVPVGALLRNVALSPADFCTLPLPDSLFWLYIPLRPLLWFRRHYLSSK